MFVCVGDCDSLFWEDHSRGRLPVQKFARGQAYWRGFGNSFQPAIVASRFNLINCDIAPSAKIITSTCESCSVVRTQNIRDARLWAQFSLRKRTILIAAFLM